MEGNFAARSICDEVILYSAPPLKRLCLCTSAKCHNGGLYLADGDGRVGNDAMTIPDSVAVGLLLMMLLAAAGLLARGKFEL